jgi:archaellum biogenesis protein FlaJ (TadC family)
MARDTELLEKRNADIEKEYVRLSKKFPHYKDEYVFKMLEEKFYLTTVTILAILSGNNKRKKRQTV